MNQLAGAHELPVLIQRLQNAALYDHPIAYFKLIETHISWVLLTGSFAYKIKKPLDLVFLDFSTLEKRHYFCQKEVELNQKWAPHVYLTVVAITGTPENPSFNDNTPAIEYAVKMREFSQEALFDVLLVKKQLPAALMDKIAVIMAHFHAKLKVTTPESPYGTALQVHELVVQNFTQTRVFLQDVDELQQLDVLEAWANQVQQALLTVFAQRKAGGFIRECHGDAHLGNIALLNDEPVFFDCIEFNESIRWTDTMADVAFLCIDLEEKQFPHYAARFLNHYLQHSGDYEGLFVLAYYKAYRAMVRAKVALFQAAQSDADAAELLRQQSRHCRDVAFAYTQAKRPYLIVLQGVSASGKSELANKLVDAMSCIVLSSDIERKRMAGLLPTADTRAPLKAGLYTTEMTDATYQRLSELAHGILVAGYSVVVDASFLLARYRQWFATLAQALQVPFVILSTVASSACLEARLTQRLTQSARISDAHHEILAQQLATLEPLSVEEQAYTLVVDTETMEKNAGKIDEVIALLREQISASC